MLKKLKDEKVVICKLNEEIKAEIEFLEDDRNAVKLDVLGEFMKVIKNPKLTYKEQNELYKSIIAYIEYKQVLSLVLCLNKLQRVLFYYSILCFYLGIIILY